MPVVEALEALCGASNAERIMECLRRYAPSWILQMPGLLEPAELANIERRTQGVTRERMLRELAQFIEALTAESGLILLIEDLHWADESTLGLIAYLAQRTQRARLLLIGTYRPEEMHRSNHPLAALMAIPSTGSAVPLFHCQRSAKRLSLTICGCTFPCRLALPPSSRT